MKNYFLELTKKLFWKKRTFTISGVLPKRLHLVSDLSCPTWNKYSPSLFLLNLVIYKAGTNATPRTYTWPSSTSFSRHAFSSAGKSCSNRNRRLNERAAKYEKYYITSICLTLSCDSLATLSCDSFNFYLKHPKLLGLVNEVGWRTSPGFFIGGEVFPNP